MEDSPISLRLEKPAVMGACLGDLPRFGALDDHTLHPSPSDFNLQGGENGRETDVSGKNPFASCEDGKYRLPLFRVKRNKLGKMRRRSFITQK